MCISTIVGFLVLVWLCQVVQAGSEAEARDNIARDSLAQPRRFGRVKHEHLMIRSRDLQEYDHPAEREGVDLRSFSNVDFRNSLAKKQAGAAAVITDVTGEIVASGDIDSSNNAFDTLAGEQINADMPIGDIAMFAEGPEESPLAAVPASYQVRIGEDGELDGGEDFGDHTDYNSSGVHEEDYDEELDEVDWTAASQAGKDDGVGVGDQGAVP